MKKVKWLYSEFKPEHYELYLEPDREKAVFSGKVVIDGRKIGRPSRRITLHQKGLKVTGVKLQKMDKRGVAEEIPLARTNSIKSFEELRLHASGILYPGIYKIKLDYRLPAEKLPRLAAGELSRELLPCIDEPEAWAQVEVEIKQ